MLDVAIRRWVNCGHEGMHMASNNNQTGCGIQAMIDCHLQAQNVSRKHSPHNYTTSTAWTVDTRQGGFMD